MLRLSKHLLMTVQKNSVLQKNKGEKMIMNLVYTALTVVVIVVVLRWMGVL